MKAAIELQNVTVRYHQTFDPVVDDVSLQVEQGELAMLIGPNGSGKTTLIKAMIGLLPYEGTIKIVGRDIEVCEHAIGYVPQTHTIDLTFPMTVSEFLHFSHANCPDYVNRPNHIVHTLGSIAAQDLKSKPLSSLSGGQLQRVLLARAIMHHPRVLILDEPETGIDVGGEQTLYDLLIQLKNKHHITILVSTHEIDLVKHYADQVIALNRSLVGKGDPKEILTLDNLHKLYGHHVHNYYA